MDERIFPNNFAPYILAKRQIQICLLHYFCSTASEMGKGLECVKPLFVGGGALFLDRGEFFLYFKFLFCGRTKQTLIFEACQQYSKNLGTWKEGEKFKSFAVKAFFYRQTHSSKVFLANSSEHCKSEVYIIKIAVIWGSKLSYKDLKVNLHWTLWV